MRVNAEWQARQIAMAKAKVELSRIWDESELSVLEWTSVLSDELSSVLTRHRNRIETNPLTGPVGPEPPPAPDPGEPVP